MALSRHTGHVNKLYLANAIQSVESHNRREQESDCWRQHKLLEKIRHDDLSNLEDENRVISRRVRCFTETTLDADCEERARWAAKKVRQMAEVNINESSATYASTKIVHEVTIQNDVKSVRSKEDKKSKRDKSKRKKEKKKKEDDKKEEKKEKRKSREVTTDVVAISDQAGPSKRVVINSRLVTSDRFVNSSRVVSLDG